MNKRILASVLAVVLAVSGLSALSATASVANLTSGDYTYSVNSAVRYVLRNTTAISRL